jgi:hypothetical protein
LLGHPHPIRGPKPADHTGQLRGRRRQRQLTQPLLIDNVDHPGDLPHLLIRQPTLPKQAGDRRHAPQRLGDPDMFPSHPGVIEQHHDNQWANDLKSVQYRIALMASNSPSNSNNTY